LTLKVQHGIVSQKTFVVGNPTNKVPVLAQKHNFHCFVKNCPHERELPEIVHCGVQFFRVTPRHEKEGNLKMSPLSLTSTCPTVRDRERTESEKDAAVGQEIITVSRP
jgi:hypothetical protein